MALNEHEEHVIADFEEEFSGDIARQFEVLNPHPDSPEEERAPVAAKRCQDLFSEARAKQDSTGETFIKEMNGEEYVGLAIGNGQYLFVNSAGDNQYTLVENQEIETEKAIRPMTAVTQFPLTEFMKFYIPAMDR